MALLTGLGALLTAGCDFVREDEVLGPSLAGPTVQVVLFAGTVEAWAVADLQAGSATLEDLSLTGPDGVVDFEPVVEECPDRSAFSAPFEIACLRATLSDPIAPGDHYTLLGETSAGTDVAGETTIPAPVTLESAPSDTLEGHTVVEPGTLGRLTVEWTPPPEAGGTVITVDGITALRSDGSPAPSCSVRSSPFDGSVVDGTSVEVTLRAFTCDADVIVGELTLTAADSALAAFRTLLSEGPQRPPFPSFGLDDGAPGVFGSGAPVRRTFRLSLDR